MSNATLSIRAHFDGRVIVPDEPVDLPLDTPLKIEVRSTDTVSGEVMEVMSAAKNPRTVARRLAGFAKFTARLDRRPSGPGIAAEALRREHMYGDEER